MQTIDAETLFEELKKINSKLNTGIIEKKTKRKEGSYQLKQNGTARLQYMLDGQRYSETVPVKNEEDAESKLALFVDTIKKGSFVNTNYTVTEFAQIWIDNKVRPNSDINRVPKYLNHLNNRILPKIGHIKLKKLSRQHLESFFNDLKKSKTLYKNRQNTTIKKGTVEKIKKIINAMLNYAVECNLIVKNPCQGIKIKYISKLNDIEDIKKNSISKLNKISYFTIEEYKNVCSLLEKEFEEFYNDTTISNTQKLREVARRLIILLALKTGMRRSELFGLARGDGFNDLNLEDRTFNVNKSRHYAKDVGKYTKDTKNSSSVRIKSLPISLIRFIKMYFDYLDMINWNNIYIFDCLSMDGLSSWWDKWLKKNNIKDIRLHDLRHTHPTILLALGVDMKTISERLDHADIQTTFNIYANVMKELDENASKKIDNL